MTSESGTNESAKNWYTTAVERRPYRRTQSLVRFFTKRRGTGVFVVGHDRLSSIDPLGGNARRGEGCRDDPGGQQFAGSGHDVERPRRHLPQHGERLDDVGQLIDLRLYLSDQWLLCRAGHQLTYGGDMSIADLAHLRERVVELRGAGRGGDAEQPVGDTAHRGHHDCRTASIARPRRPYNFNQASDSFGVGDGGAAEFLNDHVAWVPASLASDRVEGLHLEY